MPPIQAETTDAELLRRSSSGDADAFDAFVLRHERSILRYVSALAETREAAEDALQESFLSAWRAAGSFRGESAARSWLFQIARRALLRRQRRRAGEPAHPVPLHELGSEAGWSAAPLPSHVQRLEDRDLIATCLERLNPLHREVLILRELEEYTNEQTANILALTVQATKSRLHRARLSLLAEVRQELSDEC